VRSCEPVVKSAASLHAPKGFSSGTSSIRQRTKSQDQYERAGIHALSVIVSSSRQDLWHHVLALKNRDSFPLVSKQLGTRLSGNGDLLGFIRRSKSWRRMGSNRVCTALGPSSPAPFGLRTPSTVAMARLLHSRGVCRGSPVGLEAAIRPTRRPSYEFAAREVWGASGIRQKRPGGEISLSSEVAKIGWPDDPAWHGCDTPNGVMSLRISGWSCTGSGAIQTYFDRVKATMLAWPRLDAEFEVNPLWYLRKVITVHGPVAAPWAEMWMRRR